MGEGIFEKVFVQPTSRQEKMSRKLTHIREIFCEAGIVESWRNGATLSRRRGKLAILTNGSLQDGGQGCQGGEKSEKLSANPNKKVQQNFFEMFTMSTL